MRKLYLSLAIIVFSLFTFLIKGVNFFTVFILFSIYAICFSIILNNTVNIKNKKYLNLILKIYNTILIIFIVSFIFIESILIININQFKEVKDIENLKYIIVLGAGLDGYKVGKTLQSRLDKAVEYYKLNPNAKIIVSGGQGKDEMISEAVAMKRYLIENGVNENKIIKEDKATTTLENLKFSKDILKNRKDEKTKVLIVTNEFHLTRSMIIANILGVENEGLASQTPMKIRINYLIREYPTMIIDLIRTSFYSLTN
ncbi:YdcF family protein [Paraclostridium tenue]|uniref:DUF218 domain-containing protein n=1 Tax=Paraclostridium tenue TaxID=1737 RepID=A0ABP3XJ30_9FIRM